MKRKVVSVIVSVIASVCIAAEMTETNALSKAERRRIRMEQRLIRDGGLVTKPNLGKTVRFVDCQKRVPHLDVEETAKAVKSVINMPVYSVRSEVAEDVIGLARMAIKEPKTGAAVLLVENDTLPAILVAPERSWAVVNVTALTHDFPPKDVLSTRVRKELMRAAAWALGAGESMMKPCIMQYAPTLSALDANKLMMPSPDPMMRMVNGALARGIETIREDTYRDACREGWAPAPTNDVQRAIWEKVKADKERGPSNPIKIEPPKK